MDPYLGQIILNPLTFVPKNWHACDGTLLQTDQEPALFSLLANRYGGDGRITFALPNLKSPDGKVQYIIAIVGRYPERS